MSEEYKITRKNVAGRYHVDESCIYCELCVETNPANFAYDDDEGFAYVSQQPQSSAEHRLMAECISDCPIESIHDTFPSSQTAIDNLGLSRSVTPTSIGWSAVQIIVNLFRRK